jgi:glutamate racemase
VKTVNCGGVIVSEPSVVFGVSESGATSWTPVDLGLEMPRSTLPIGVFDSGVGGLTVLRELYRHLPNESIVYFGDTARVPYGTRGAEEILQFVREILIWMEQQGCKMVIMACNTSSALALEQVRSEFDIPVLGVVLPGAKAAVEAGQRIGVIATPATAKSGAYGRAIREISAGAEVWEVGCPEFVPIIEAGRIYAPETREIVQKYLAPLLEANIDTLIYGCTHYPHLAPVIRELVPASVQLIDPAVHMAKSAGQELQLLHLINGQPALPTYFGVSGEVAPFVAIAKEWLGYTPTVHSVMLPTVPAAALPMTALPVTAPCE